ncbi:MAG: prepilin-type N-terminal cleavage/methylation domain-containing protein [bacterium]
MKVLYKKRNTGFTFVELIVGVAVFLVIVISVYTAYTSIFDTIKASRAKIEAVNLVNEQLEIIRNLPYSDVGITGSIPDGVLSHAQKLTRSGNSYYATTTVRNIDDPFDGTLGGTPNDLSPADYKLVEIDVTCASCKTFTPVVITTKVAPKNLETSTTNGALFVKVFDANGNPIPEASVHIVNNQESPAIVIDDVTNNSGVLQIVDAPPGVNAYEITVTKSGYSTDKTYAVSGGNPNPTKPNATVVLQQVTQTSFIIDKLSTLNVSSMTADCTPVPSIDFTLTGNKLIGTPSVYKYSQNKATNSSGNLSLTGIEWDSYNLSNIDTSYDFVGVNPNLPINITPNSIQNLSLIVATKNPRTVLITVKDSSTGLPLSGVEARLTKDSYTNTKMTGLGFILQTDWSGGGGQATSTDGTKYFSSDGNIEINNPAGDISLKKIFSDYVSSGTLTSSTFDIGFPVNFQQINWNPGDQPVSTGNPNVRFQIATNNDGGTWNFVGPDGTNSTYYTTSNKSVSSANNNARYIRYKVFLDTAVTTATPNISDVSITYTSSCTPPGQVSFSSLSSGTYTLHLEKEGYADQDVSIPVTQSWQAIETTMSTN